MKSKLTVCHVYDEEYDKQVQALLRNQKAMVVYTPPLKERTLKNLSKYLDIVKYRLQSINIHTIKQYVNIKTVLESALCLFMLFSIISINQKLNSITTTYTDAMMFSENKDDYVIVDIHAEETEVYDEPTTTAETTATTTAATISNTSDGKVRTYNVSLDICKFIASYEGRKKDEPYKCESDCWTIGYGHAYTSQESREWSREKALSEFNKDIEKSIGKQYCITNKHPRLSNDEAMLLLQYDLNHGLYKKRLDEFITKNKIIMNQQQYDACISFAYNCGPNVWTKKAFKFRDTLVKYKDCSKIPAGIACNQLDNWNHGANNKELKGLTRRRRNEARLFSTGSYDILNSPDDYIPYK